MSQSRSARVVDGVHLQHHEIPGRGQSGCQVATDLGNGRGDVRHVGVIGAVNEAHERSHAGIGAGTRGGTALLTARVEKLN